MSSAGLASVDAYTTAVRQLLQEAQEIKPHASIEPALTVSDFGGGIEIFRHAQTTGKAAGNQGHYAAIETAFRNIFYELLAANSIEDSSFSDIWNLLDIVSIFSDNEQCEPGLVFWLVEELLDSQTIDGCRRIFDYLDSRRERMTAKHFKSKHLIILRACNELLRRLSRAEDTVFCGRVFIFLFQSFPLGDRSSVNLRGEYHVDNVTVYDEISSQNAQNVNDMEVDTEAPTKPVVQNVEHAAPTGLDASQAQQVGDNTVKEGKSVTFFEKPDGGQDTIPDMDTLYPIFWALQESFSNPTILFESSKLETFKIGLSSTLGKFKQVHQDLESRGTLRSSDESKRSLKRKRWSPDDDMASSFNPKYLTSRDLFDLEISDLAFRRHVLVQALILVDFLLSLTPKSKSKLENMSNKSVLYRYILEEEDAKWATHMRTEIATYLQQGPEGKFYYRMVDTVLSRDKNWVHWKAENCPPIERASLSAEDFVNARNGAQKACANKRLRAMPLGSLDLSFLSDRHDVDGLEKLKIPERFWVPTAESFRGPIAEDEFDIEMAKTEEDKQLARSARASKMWRTLRIAARNKLNLFDRIDDGNNLRALFESSDDENEAHKGGEYGDQAQQDETFGPSIDSISTKLGLDTTTAHEAVVK